MHSGGGGGHLQSALPAGPVHGLPALHVLVGVATRHDCASRVQVTTVLVAPSQNVPVALLQIVGGAGQAQDADGCAPEHGLSGGHVVDGPLYTHPSPSSEQVSRALVALQKEPAPFSHPAGRAGQVQRALGSASAHTRRPPQSCSVPQVGQPTTAMHSCSPELPQRLLPNVHGLAHDVSVGGSRASGADGESAGASTKATGASIGRPPAPARPPASPVQLPPAPLTLPSLAPPAPPDPVPSMSPSPVALPSLPLLPALPLPAPPPTPPASIPPVVPSGVFAPVSNARPPSATLPGAAAVSLAPAASPRPEPSCPSRPLPPSAPPPASGRSICPPAAVPSASAQPGGPSTGTWVGTLHAPSNTSTAASETMRRLLYAKKPVIGVEDTTCCVPDSGYFRTWQPSR